MFTGIITDLGTLLSREGKRLSIDTNYNTSNIDIGASIACDGACLTVVEKEPGILHFDVSPETDAKTTLSSWTAGRRVNLERALQVGQELGGHLVTGHVDTVGEVIVMSSCGTQSVIAGSGAGYPVQARCASQDDASTFWQLEIAYPAALSPYFAPKGSVTINGVSLTVNTVSDASISLTLIPHTAAVTNLGLLQPGNTVNLEVDLIARYIAPYLQKSRFS